MDKMVALCKRRGFIFPSCEIYGGLAGVWDYGPLGVELKRNIKEYWWVCMTQYRDDIVGLDSAILTHRAVLQASGHEGQFVDELVECKECHSRFRTDELGAVFCPLRPKFHPGQCGAPLTEPRRFHLLFKTQLGPVEESAETVYLRPETAQGIFVQFRNVLEVSRKKLPFGIAQIGKAFRNEVNPRHFTFRSREFEQMEVEYFVKPGTGLELLERWKEERLAWYESLGLPRSKIRVRDVPESERAFYSQKTYDLEYEFPFGTHELEGIAYRTDYDLVQHARGSGKPLDYFDEETQTRFVPHVIEPSGGVDRTVLALLCEAYNEEEVKEDGERGKEVRTVLRLSPRVAPIKVGVLPLLRNRPELVAKAQEVASWLRRFYKTAYDEAGSIGRRYRRMDEIGTPFCVTIDFETLEGVRSGPLAGRRNTVTVRDRDTMAQERVAIEDLLEYLAQKVSPGIGGFFVPREGNQGLGKSWPA
ncbi:glycine--tRNA ligase [Candidatus Methylacidithermus pantelleriae]